VAFIKKEFPEAHIVCNPTNLGYAGGCNSGASAANGKYILLLNNDTIQDPGWIEPLVELAESRDDISSVQSKLLNYTQRNHFDYAGASGGYMDIFVIPFARGRLFDTVEEDLGQYEDAAEIFWASGTAFLTRNSIFQEMGGFDEVLFAHMEEIDYHWKCHLAGYSVYIQPESVVYHKGAVTLPESSPVKTYLNHRNSLLLLLTNYNFTNSLFLAIPRLGLEMFSMLKEIVQLNFDHALAHLKSLGWLITHPSVISQRRRNIKKLRQISDSIVMNKLYKGSVIWDYFARGRKKWSDLSI